MKATEEDWALIKEIFQSAENGVGVQEANYMESDVKRMGNAATIVLKRSHPPAFAIVTRMFSDGTEIGENRLFLLQLDSMVPGSGSGTVVLNAVKRFVSGERYGALLATTTQSNARARAFYKKRGFTEVDSAEIGAHKWPVQWREEEDGTALVFLRWRPS